MASVDAGTELWYPEIQEQDIYRFIDMVDIDQTFLIVMLLVWKINLRRDLGPVTEALPWERTWDQWNYHKMEMGTPRKDMGPVVGSWMGWTRGNPPSPCEQTDIPKYKQYLPRHYVRGWLKC